MIRACSATQVSKMMRVSTDPNHVAFATVQDIRMRPTPNGPPHYEIVLQEGGAFYVEVTDVVWVQE